MQAQGSPLVQGAVAGAQAPVRLRVLRAFLLGGVRQEVGSIALVPRQQVAELLYQRRAERVPDVPAPAPAVTAPTAAPAKADAAPKTTPRAAGRAQEQDDAA